MPAVVEEKTDKLPQPGEVLKTRKNEFEVLKLLGKGGFGAVFEVKRINGDDYFAAKFETFDVKKQVLTMDCRVLQGAHSIKSPHFCTIIDRGKVIDRFRYLVMKLVGQNLWELRIQREFSRFSLSTALKMAEQCLVSIEDLHRIGYLHRDIKPGNFAIGRGEETHTVFMLDFGLCRKFIKNTEEKDLRVPRDSAPFRGTTRYAPIASLKQIEQSRKDDVEAWLYMVVEWTAGSLPWRKLKGTDKGEVLKWKEDVRKPEHQDEFLVNCPKRQFLAIMQYLDQLAYHSIPDYVYILHCLFHAMKVNNFSGSEPLDWDPDHPYHGPTRADREKRIELEVKEEENEEPTLKKETKKDLKQK